MTHPEAKLTIPNVISAFRLLLAPVGLWLASQGHECAYKWVFAVAVVSDGADGLLARCLNCRTLLGARLDAVADGATYLVLFLAVQRLWPDFLASHFAILVGLVGLYAINHIWALVRFRQLPAYHTWAGKAAAVLMAPGVMVWFISGQGMLLTVAFIVAIVSVVEQFAITTCLPNWRADVPTFVHALRLRRATQQNHSH